MLKCRICGHKWQPRTEKEPLACPRCKRYDWKEAIKISVIILFSLFTIPTLARATTWTTLSQSDFNLGTYSWAYYNTTTGAVILNHAGALVYNSSGNYTSKIFDAGASATWNNISWVEGVPYGEGLLDNQVDRSATILGEANMTGNVLLLHLNSVNNTNYTLDTSGNGNDGQVKNYTCDPATCNLTVGKFNNSLVFNGINNWVNISNSNKQFTDGVNNSFTVVVWVNLSSLASNMEMVSVWNAVTNNKAWRLVTVGTGTDALFRVSSDGITNNADASAYGVLATNTWTHVAATYDGSNTKIYINGNLKNTTSYNQGFYSTALNLQIGASNSGSCCFFNGSIDEVAIWNRTLSATEILNLYKRGALRLNITTKSCDDVACSGESWNETHTNATLSTLHEQNNRYFQYKVQFETENTSYTPELYNVTINYISLGTTPNSTTVKRGDFVNITINSSSAPTANITKPNGAVTWLATPTSKGSNIYETNYTFLSSDPSGSYRIGANSSTNSQTTNVTMNSTIMIAIESDKMSSSRIVRSRSEKSIIVYGIAKYAIDSAVLNGKTVTVDYSSTTIGTNTTNAAGSYNYTFSITYDGDYYLNVNISDNSNNTGTNSTNMAIKSRPTYVKYRFSFHLGNYSNTTYRIATPTTTNVSLSTINTTNQQYSSNLSHAYVCTYNELDYSGGMLLALAHSYKMSDLDYVNFSTNFTSQASNYTLELINKVDDSKLVLVYTQGTCQLVDDKMYLIEKQTIPTKSMASFALETPDQLPVSIIAQYDKIQLFGTERFGKGSHRICIEKPGVSEGNKPLVNISRC